MISRVKCLVKSFGHMGKMKPTSQSIFFLIERVVWKQFGNLTIKIFEEVLFDWGFTVWFLSTSQLYIWYVRRWLGFFSSLNCKYLFLYKILAQVESCNMPTKDKRHKIWGLAIKCLITPMEFFVGKIMLKFTFLNAQFFIFFFG